MEGRRDAGGPHVDLAPPPLVPALIWPAPAPSHPRAPLRKSRSSVAALPRRRAAAPVLRVPDPLRNPSPPRAPGVTCGSGRVAVLRLPGAALSGQIPAGTLGNLTALHTLSLRLDGLSGALPADLASASAAALRNVFVNGNSLSGGALGT